MKRRQQYAQAKAAKHCCAEKRQHEAQAMAAKCQSESLWLPGVQGLRWWGSDFGIDNLSFQNIL